MATVREWMRRLWGTIRRNPLDREMEEELRSHLELAAEDLRQRGGSSDDALREARLQAGGVVQAMDALRDQRGVPWLEDFARDARYGLRSLWRSPAFTTAALLTLALAIGANTTMFSVVNAVLLRPLPYPSPEQLAMVWTGAPDQNFQGRPSYWTVQQWQQGSKSFADMAVFDPVSVTLTTGDDAERIRGMRISPNYFPLLGIQPVQGRIFSDEDAEQRRRVVLISHEFWQARFAGSDSAVGASLVLDGLPSQVIGILPEIQNFDRDVWEPHTLFPDWESRRSDPAAGGWFVVGRLRPGVSVDQAQAEMSAVARVIDEQLPPEARNRGSRVMPLSLYVVGPRPRLALWMLAGAVFCVLLIAAANAASLSLARSVVRAREIALRATLGASPARIMRQLLAESVALAGISGFLGTLLAFSGIRLVQALGPADLARLNEASLDLSGLGWAMAISLLTGILVGLAPALPLLRRRLRLSVADGGRNVSGGVATRGSRRVLVVAQFALAIVLMAGAGLLIRSWQHATNVDPGFRPERVLSMQISTTAFTEPTQRTRFYDRVLEEIESVPGVESAGIIGDLFISNDAERLITAERNGGAVSERVRLRVDEASAAVFTALGAPLLRGRFFSVEDGPDSPLVAIVNDTMARRLWPGDDPVGRRFKFGPIASENGWVSVVGVVGDMRRQGLEIEPIPQMFVPLAQDPSGLETLLVRTSTEDPMKIAASVRAAVGRVEKQVPLYGVTTLEQRMGTYLAQRRFQTALLIAFSVVALLMAAIGIYGLIHYSVAMRTQEIGIRVAVGAQPRQIFRMVVREGLKLALMGLGLGLAGALWLAQAGSSLLFGVTATDPVTFSIVSLLLIAVAGAACCFPARRAMKVEPVVAFRQG